MAEILLQIDLFLRYTIWWLSFMDHKLDFTTMQNWFHTNLKVDQNENTIFIL